MRLLITLLFLTLMNQLCVTLPTACAATVEEERAEVRAMANDTLAKLYKLHPSAKRSIKGAAGYAVFSNFGMKILFFGGGSGKGIVVNLKTKKETFMKMIEVQGGLGLGVKKFQVIFVFETHGAIKDFIEQGWEFGGQTTAAAKHGDEGDALQGAMVVSEGMFMYQLTESGLAAEITGKGTKYYKDDDLNR